MVGKTNLAIENSSFPTDKSYVQCLDTDIANMTAESLNFWNIKFVEELWKENGEGYPPRLLNSIVCAISWKNIKMELIILLVFKFHVNSILSELTNQS